MEHDGKQSLCEFLPARVDAVYFPINVVGDIAFRAQLAKLIFENTAIGLSFSKLSNEVDQSICQYFLGYRFRCCRNVCTCAAGDKPWRGACIAWIRTD